MSARASAAVRHEGTSPPGPCAAGPAPHSAPAFEILFHTYHARLCAFAVRYVGCPDTAEEVVEDVFLRIWARRKHEDEEGRCSRRYLYTAVRNQALNVLDHERVVRRARGLVLHQEHLPGMSQPPAAADEQLQAEELAAALQRAVDQLPERCRQAHVLHRQHGMSYAEIAEVMGISTRTVETQLGRAARTLRRTLAAWMT